MVKQARKDTRAWGSPPSPTNVHFLAVERPSTRCPSWWESRDPCAGSSEDRCRTRGSHKMAGCARFSLENSDQFSRLLLVVPGAAWRREGERAFHPASAFMTTGQGQFGSCSKFARPRHWHKNGSLNGFPVEPWLRFQGEFTGAKLLKVGRGWKRMERWMGQGRRARSHRGQ